MNIIDQRRSVNKTDIHTDGSTPSDHLNQLVQNGARIAIDTEFQGANSLSVQVATRGENNRLLLQLYRDQQTQFPVKFSAKPYLSDLRDRFKNYSLRPTKVLRTDHSPARMIRDLFGIEGVKPVTRAEAFDRLKDRNSAPANGSWDAKRGRCRVPSIRLTLVGHFLQADLLRAFGKDFYSGVMSPIPEAPKVELAERRRLAFVSGGGTFRDHQPILEFLETADGRLYAIRVATFDTMLPFGPGSLEKLAQSFLGLGKFDGLREEDKRQMAETFRLRPQDAFGYGLRDAVLTLLLFEEMSPRDRAIYRALGLPADRSAEMKPTIGGRVSDVLLAAARKESAGSQLLANEHHLKQLMRAGGSPRFAPGHHGSRFGLQTGAVHGGLLFSRTPTDLWHKAPGMLRDVDMRSCYPEVIKRTNIYIGRPVLWEPGDRRMSIAEAVAYVQQNAPDDAWLIHSTGDINTVPNTLIPSTHPAVTGENYRKQRRSPPSSGATLQETRFPAKLFSARIESGVITAATWNLIQALPEATRREYEQLTAESILLYPGQFITTTGEDFDTLHEKQHHSGLPWVSELNLEDRQLLQTELLDHEFVTFQFPVRDYAEQIDSLRRQARQKHGAGSGEELAFKLLGNSLYGVLASFRCLPSNVVAANVITAQARASAWAMFQALNGLQVITDGCSYRLDRIPRCTFRECLELQPDYPLRHADENCGIPFYEPSAIPNDDVTFNPWFREHVQRFFELDESAANQLLIHDIEHKLTGTTGSPAFDALACDGSGNHVKLTASAEGWQVQECRLRGYGTESKELLEPWIIRTYSGSRMCSLPPVTADMNLLRLEPAKQITRKMLDDPEVNNVLLPLGFEAAIVKAYSALKLSAFVCRTPRQFRTLQQQIARFRQETGCGLDVLALRRPHRRGSKKEGGSLSSIAQALYDFISEGGADLSKCFNFRPTRLSGRIEVLVRERQYKKRRLRGKSLRKLAIAMQPKFTQQNSGFVVTRNLEQSQF